MDDDDGGVHRAVSPIEMYSVARHQLDYYRCVTFYLRFECLSSHFLLDQWQSRIENALRSTLAAQPRLRLQVDLSGPQAQFIVLPIDVFDRLPLRVVPRTNGNDENETFLIEMIEKEVNTPFSYDRCSALWRVLLLVGVQSETFDLIVSFNHAIADGISGMAFFTTFAQCLAGQVPETFLLANDRPFHQMIPSNLPPLSSLISDIVEKLLLPKRLSQYFFPKAYWTGPIRLTGSEVNHTRLVSFTLPVKVVEALQGKCRREETTINSALLAALLLSITKIFGKERIEFSCNTAVNVRPYCHPEVSNGQMGVFVSSADTSHFITCEENLMAMFWPLARQIREQISREIADAALPMIQALKFVSNWTNVLREQRAILPNGLPHSVDISNLLRWTFDTTDPSWKVLHGGFSQSANLVGSVFAASVVTVNGVLKVHLSFQEAIVGERFDQAKELRDRMEEYLRRGSFEEWETKTGVICVETIDLVWTNRSHSFFASLLNRYTYNTHAFRHVSVSLFDLFTPFSLSLSFTRVSPCKSFRLSCR